MKRTLLVGLSCVLLCGILLGDNCPPPPNQNPPCPSPPFATKCKDDGGNCTLSLDWFITNRNCVGDQHAPIWIMTGQTLTIQSSATIKSRFKVEPFKRYPLTIDSDGKLTCDYHAGTPGSANPFHDPNLVNWLNSHSLVARDIGCYEVNLTLETIGSGGEHCKIDPHIIVGGTGMISPTALYEPKQSK